MFLTLNVTGFIFLQVVAALFFKWGGTAPEFYWRGFAIGNLFGMSSIMLLINVYKALTPNLAMALCSGGAFVCVQCALALVFKQHLGLLAVIGIFMITGGIVLISLCKLN